MVEKIFESILLTNIRKKRFTYSTKNGILFISTRENPDVQHLENKITRLEVNF